MSAARRIAFVALFLSLAWHTAPRLIEGARVAFDLRGLSADERRARVIGPFYESVQRIVKSTPPGEPLAVITDARPDLDAALFFVYYAFPRTVVIYKALDLYRMDERRPKTTVRIDLARSPEARLMPYAEIRAEQIGGRHIVYAPSAGEEESRSFAVPLVSSGDGPAPDVYTTEVAMENGGASPARVTATIHPSGRRTVIDLAPGEKRTWADFVWQAFGSMEVGWLEVQSDAPVRARFWFVNRGRRDADVLRWVKWFRSAKLIVPARGRLWVINPHESELAVRLNGAEHRLPPRAVIPLEWVGGADIASEREWYAFVTWRDAEQNTRFEWPEGR